MERARPTHLFTLASLEIDSTRWCIPVHRGATLHWMSDVRLPTRYSYTKGAYEIESLRNSLWPEPWQKRPQWRKRFLSDSEMEPGLRRFVDALRESSIPKFYEFARRVTLTTKETRERISNHSPIRDWTGDRLRTSMNSAELQESNRHLKEDRRQVLDGVTGHDRRGTIPRNLQSTQFQRFQSMRKRSGSHEGGVNNLQFVESTGAPNRKTRESKESWIQQHATETNLLTTRELAAFLKCTPRSVQTGPTSDGFRSFGFPGGPSDTRCPTSRPPFATPHPAITTSHPKLKPAARLIGVAASRE